MKWRLTPAEPTPEMVRHGEYAADACYREDPCGKGAEHIYKDMLSAAPDPLEDAELVERVAVAVERELDIEEAVLADPLTKRRLKAQRIARQVIAAMKGE